MGKENIWMQGDLEININSTKPYGDSDIIDASEFLESLDIDGEFEILSCCCGVPECSGWFKGIQVEHLNNEHIKWTNLNNGENWIFEKKSIEDALKNIEEELENYKAFFKERNIEYVGYGY